MSYRHTLEAALESLQDIEELIKGFPDSGDVPSIELDLSLQKLRNIYELLLVLKKPVDLSTDQPPAAASAPVTAPVISTISAPIQHPFQHRYRPRLQHPLQHRYRLRLQHQLRLRFRLRLHHQIRHRLHHRFRHRLQLRFLHPFPHQHSLPYLFRIHRQCSQNNPSLKRGVPRSSLTVSKDVQPCMKPCIKIWARMDSIIPRESRLKT